MYILMIMGTLISMSSNSWFSMWVGLELNLIGFIKIMLKTKSSYLVECAMKYFIIQIFSSFMFVTFMLELINVFYFKMNIILIIINFMMMMKMGFSPFHFWLINMFNLMPWKMLMILLTWQKFIPMWMLSYYLTKKIIILIIIMINMFTSSLGLINQTNLKKLFLYSSLNHNSWMLSSLLVNKYWWSNYLIGYSIILMPIMIIMMMNNFNMINNMVNSNLSYWMKNIILVGFLSMSGLPPFLGFILKWYLILKFKYNLIVIVMMLLTSINIYIYIKMLLYSMMMFNNKIKITWWVNVNWLTMIWLMI